MISKGKFLYLRRLYAMTEFIRKIRPKGDGIDIFALCNRMSKRQLMDKRFQFKPRKLAPKEIKMGTPESWHVVGKIATAICEPILQRQQLVNKDGSDQ